MEQQVPGSEDNTGDNETTGTREHNDERRDHFVRMLLDDEALNRIRAAEMLGRMRDPATVEDLISTLWDDDPRVRLKAAWALGMIGDMRAYAPLQRLYRMEGEWAQEIIRESLDAIRTKNVSSG